MKNEINLFFFIILFLSCSQKKDDINTGIAHLQPIKIEPTYNKTIEIKQDSTQFWVLENKLGDKELSFELYFGRENLPFDKWIFNLSDSNNVKSFINHQPSCAMGLSIIDTTIWIATKNYVDITIKGYQIGNSEFEYNFHCRKESINDYKFKLLKIY